jgi:hypothetical protein
MHEYRDALLYYSEHVTYNCPVHVEDFYMDMNTENENKRFDAETIKYIQFAWVNGDDFLDAASGRQSRNDKPPFIFPLMLTCHRFQF